MTVTSFILLKDGLNTIKRSKAHYYCAIDPESKYYDPDMPKAISLGTSPTSPRAFIAAELEAYRQKLVERSRQSVSEDNQGE